MKTMQGIKLNKLLNKTYMYNDTIGKDNQYAILGTLTILQWIFARVLLENKNIQCNQKQSKTR